MGIILVTNEFNEMDTAKVFSGRVSGTEEISNRDSAALIGFEHSEVKDVLETFLIQNKRETTVSIEKSLGTVASKNFTIDHHFVARRGFNRGLVEVRGVHGSRNAEHGDDDLVLATSGGHKIHAVFFRFGAFECSYQVKVGTEHRRRE